MITSMSDTCPVIQVLSSDKMPELKQAREVKHFIYVNRTNFGLYNMLHELGAKVKTDTYKPQVNSYKRA